jgi:hypothetical protein
MNHGLEVLYLIGQGSEEASAEIDHVREEIMSNQNRPVGSHLLLQLCHRCFQVIFRFYGWRVQRGSETARVEIRQIAPS